MDVASRYKLLEKIGAGSFATVYRAQDQELGREVAVHYLGERMGAAYAERSGEVGVLVEVTPKKVISWDYARESNP